MLQQHVNGVPFWSARPETASRVRSRIEKILDAAKVSRQAQRAKTRRDGRGISNTCSCRAAKAEKGKKKHFEAMPYNEVPAFVEGASGRMRKSTSPRWRWSSCILTAARVGNVSSATWEQIDLPDKVWTVPGAQDEDRKKITRFRCRIARSRF